MAKSSKEEEPKKAVEKPSKRKVTVLAATDSPESTGPPPAKIAAPETDLYAKIVNYEESQARGRDGTADAEEFINTCGEIQQLITEIAELKTNSSDADAAVALVKEKQTRVTVKIMSLKKLNRLEKMRMKDSRDALQKYREQVDSDHLHLQNLLYENIHLGKEVKKCYDFKSIDEDMDLVPLEEFYASAPSSIAKEEITKSNPHELKLARLTWELTQRKELAAQLKKLEQAKESVTRDIESRKEQLATLGPHLKTIIDSTKPLQTLLNIPVDKVKKMHELALLLPKPLYVMFVQAEAYSQIVSWMSVSIVGKEDEARQPEEHYEEIASDSSDSDNEEEKESSRRRKPNRDRRKGHGKAGEESLEARKSKVLGRHALSVQLNISLSGGVIVTLTFHWLRMLEAVTVSASVAGYTVEQSSGVAVADLLASASLLSAMYPGDTGETCPNPTAAFHLQWAGLTELPVEAGVPYTWAHTLCGLTYLKTAAHSTTPNPQISQLNMETTLRVIRDRLRSRIALAKEIRLLESGEALRDKRLQATISSFTAVTISDLQRTDSGARLMQLNVVDGSYLVYRAGIDVHGIKMAALICLPPTYPSTLPIVVLEVLQKPVLTAVNNDHIRDIEREVNTRLLSGDEDDEKDGQGELLLRQVYSLLLCAELLTATELSPDTPVKATFFRAVMGRRRSHPYRHMSTAGGIFTHR